jgi:hypothetical protein
VRGKARFYVSFRDNNYYSTVAGLPGVETQSRLSNATFKVNYSLNPRNTLIGFYTWRYKLDSERDLSAAVPPESTRNQVGLMHLGKVEWTSILTDRLFLDFQAGTHIASNEYTSPLNKSRDTTGLPVGRQDLVTGQFSGTNPSLAYNPDSRPQLTGSLSWSPAAKLWGAHFVKLGFQIHTFSAGGEPFMAGDIFYYDRNGVPAEVQIYNTPLTSANTNRNIGIYLQDAWNVGTRVTLNVGVRYDNYALGWPTASNTPNQTAFFQPVSGPASTPVTWNSIGPRLGVSWDVGGDSRTVAKAFIGRFYLDPSTDVTVDANPVGKASRRYVFNDISGNKLLDAGELGNFLSTSGGGGAVRIDPNIKPPYGDELSLHVEREVFTGASLRVSYVYKTLRNYDAEVDIGYLAATKTPYTYLDAGPDNVVGTPDDQTLNLLDREKGAVSDRMWTTPGAAVGTPANDANYQTLEAAFNRRFKDKWMLMTSFGNTWLNEFTTEGGRSGVQDFAGNEQGFRWDPNRRSFGKSETSYWNYKLVGRYTTPFWGISAATTYRLMSGYNWVRTLSVKFPVAGSVTIPASEVSLNRAPKVSIVDVRLDKSLNIGSGKMMFVVDLSNLLNAGTVTNFRTGSGSRFKEIIALLPGRSVRVGVEVRF